MATIYVNTAVAGNGYAAGNDSNDGLSKSAPKLTIQAAVTAAGASGTVVANGGTYNGETTYVTFSNAGCTLQADTGQTVTIMKTGAQSRVVHINASNITLSGDIVLDAATDAGADATWCISCSTTGDVSGLTLTGITMLNPTSSFIYGGRLTSLTMNGGWTASATSLTGDDFEFISGTPSAPGVYDISDGTVTSVHTDAENVFGFDMAVAGASVIIHDVTVSTSSGATTTLYGVYSTGCASNKIYDNTINISGANVTAYGIQVFNDAVDTVDSCYIYGNTVTGAGTTGGIGIAVGNDASASPAGANTITDAHVYGNIVSSFNHGMLVGWVTGARVYNNYVHDVVLGIVDKSGTDCVTSGNLLIDATTNHMLQKGATRSIMTNNLAIATTGTPQMLRASANSAVNNTDGVFANNICYADGATPSRWFNGDASQTATFNANDYYGASPATPFTYNGSNVADLATWNAAANVGTDLNVDPEFTDYAGGDYTVTAATLVAAGVKSWGNVPRPVGYGGEPFPDVDIDIGAVQGTDATNHPFAPGNLGF